MFPNQQVGWLPYISIGNDRALRHLPRRLPNPNDRARSLRRAA
jgi:hypothetical protein